MNARNLLYIHVNIYTNLNIYIRTKETSGEVFISSAHFIFETAFTAKLVHLLKNIAETPHAYNYKCRIDCMYCTIDIAMLRISFLPWHQAK